MHEYEESTHRSVCMITLHFCTLIFLNEPYVGVGEFQQSWPITSFMAKGVLSIEQFVCSVGINQESLGMFGCF